MRRLWTIGARTALLFAVTSMAIVAAAFAFVNTASRYTLPSAIDVGRPSTVSGLPGGDGADDAGGDPVVPGPVGPEADHGLPTVLPDPSSPRSDADRDQTVAIASVASRVLWQWSAIGVVGTGVLAGGLGWVVSRRMLRPIDRITATTRRISATNLHERIGLDGPDDELRRLSRTVDELLDRLESAFESQRRFVAQASHELRTPLAVQRAAIQIGLQDGADADAVRDARGELLAQNRRTEHLVESLLTLAEVERGLDGRGVPLDLAEIAHDVVESMSRPAAAAGVRVLVDVGPDDVASGGAPPFGDPTLVRQALGNLVDNAVEYNAPGGIVRVHVAPDGYVVENTGDLVEDAAAAQLTEPFRRGVRRGTKRHSGLGLSIVRAVVDAHGWSLELSARDGGGLVVTIRTRRDPTPADRG